jgi:hypothetical protein
MRQEDKTSVEAIRDGTDNEKANTYQQSLISYSSQEPRASHRLHREVGTPINCSRRLLVVLTDPMYPLSGLKLAVLKVIQVNGPNGAMDNAWSGQSFRA